MGELWDILAQSLCLATELPDHHYEEERGRGEKSQAGTPIHIGKRIPKKKKTYR